MRFVPPSYPSRTAVAVVAVALACSVFVPRAARAVAPAASGGDVEKLAERAADAGVVLEEIADIPERGIPEWMLEEAHCLAVVPKVVKAGFILGGRHGRGLLTCRVDEGWSRPSYVYLTGGSFGLQIGAQATDFVLVFADRGAVQHVFDGQFTLGADASVSAGPVGRTAEAATDVKLDSEIYTYSRSKGAFAGVSIEGAKFGIDEDANEAVFGAGVDARELLTGESGSVPDAVARFLDSVRRVDPGGSD